MSPIEQVYENAAQYVGAQVRHGRKIDGKALSIAMAWGWISVFRDIEAPTDSTPDPSAA